jgi:hypothetical protein
MYLINLNKLKNILNINITKMYMENETNVIIQYVSVNEYKKVMDENATLKLRIMELYKNEEKYKDTIKTNEMTIQQLRAENEMLKQKIHELENKMTYLENKINQMEEKEQYNKFIIAIQYINRYEELETKLNGKDRQHLKRLRQNRISECHYIIEEEDEDSINDKRIILFEKIKNMSLSIRNRFDSKYPNLLNEIIKFIEPTNKRTIPDDSLSDINDWWNN